MRQPRLSTVFSSSLLLTALFFPTHSEARFATPAEASSEIELFNSTIDVKEDGSSEKVVEIKVKILNDFGRTNPANEPLQYDEAVEKLKVLDARTIDQGKEYEVTNDSIEDKAIASHTNAFSSYRRVLISFPHVHAGSELYLKYRIAQTIPYLNHTWYSEIPFGANESYWTSAKVKITSALPLEFKVHDPESYLDVHSEKDGNRQVFEVSLKKPLIRVVMDEQNVYLDNRNYPWVSTSSINDWKTLADKITPEYERVLKEPLPPLFEEIRAAAAKEPDLIKKINKVTIRLAEELNFMGDWRSASGRIFPESLEKVATTRKGVCKDFATVTTAILRKLGIHSSVALVRRGGLYEIPNGLISPILFNHAIVRVESQNQVIWVDPTNKVSFAGEIFPDISDRIALPLSEGVSSPEKTPAIQAEKSSIVITKEYDFSKKDIVSIKGTQDNKGVIAISTTGLGLWTSKENIDYQVMRYLGEVDQMLHFNVKPVDLKSRVVRDIHFDFDLDYTKRYMTLKTSKGGAFMIVTFNEINRYYTGVRDRVSDLGVSNHPTSLSKSSLLKGFRLTGKSNLNCHLDNRWLTATRHVSQKKTGIGIDDVFIMKMPLISNSDLRSKEFSQFQEKMRDCFVRVAIDLVPLGTAKAPVLASEKH